MLLTNLILFSLGFWYILSKKKRLNTLFGLVFIISCAVYIYSNCIVVKITESTFLHLLIGLFGIGFFGFLLSTFEKNKWAQISALAMMIIGTNLYISNPHTLLNSNADLAENGEIIVHIDKTYMQNLKNFVKEHSYIIKLDRLCNPSYSDITDLDDFYMLDIKKGYDINQVISDISTIDGLKWIEPNEVLRHDEIPSETMKSSYAFTEVINDPMATQQWNMEILNMGSYYTLFRNQKYAPIRPSKLFILDSGIDSKHEDIIQNFQSITKYDKATNETDAHGHGTHCAGVASAVTNNRVGIASMNPGNKWMTVSSIKVMNNFGFGTQNSVLDGIVKAVDAGADVISLSLGGISNQLEEKAYQEAITYAKQKNVILVAAAGNNANDASKTVPANSDDVITVTAIDRNKNKAQFSNHISKVKLGIAAPGVSITSPWKNKRYAAFDGTSMATPHVSGLIAVMRSLDPDMTIEEAYDILKSTGNDTQDTNLTGKLINPTQAIIECVTRRKL